MRNRFRRHIFVQLKALARKYTLPELMSAIKICCKHEHFHVFDKVFIIRKGTKANRFAFLATKQLAENLSMIALFSVLISFVRALIKKQSNVFEYVPKYEKNKFGASSSAQTLIVRAYVLVIEMSARTSSIVLPKNN